MIERYTRAEMGVLWDLEHRFGKMLEVETQVALAQAELGIIPKAAARSIRAKAKFSVKRIQEIEKITKHDVIAFVSSVAENVGPHGKFVHFGMTSSDVLDTAFSLQVWEATDLLMAGVQRLERSLSKLVKKHESTICPGRTHGMFAEPTSFGIKMAGFLMELKRNHRRLELALDNFKICKLSGAVGTYSSQPPEVEKKVAKRLGLQAESVATQVIPRDRHAEMIGALSFVMAGLERLAVELRHLQRSEVSEVVEGFTVGQKGSSAMPHKKNPISAENITGLARLVRGYFLSALENIALWHERDISHSSVERVIFPDAFIVVDYALHRMADLLDGLHVNKKKMLENLELSQGTLFSSHLLLHLVKQGFSREEAYKHVQRVAHSLGRGDHMRDLILKDSVLSKHFSKTELDSIFSGQGHQKAFKQLVKRINL